jgi:hypothetical protein
VAFFSQEFPQYVGSNFNDSFFIKFDESPDFIAAGNLNDLAGGTAEAGVADCKTNTTYSATAKCGEWQFVGENEDLYGDLWLISESTQGPSQGGSGKFNCVYGGENGKCYHGMIEPRIICANIPEGDRGQTMTLRMGVSDAGDSFYDSALAVDTVAFSTAACGAGDASRMTPAAEDPESRVNTL